MLEEIYPDLNEEGGIKMDEIRDKHCRNVDEEGDNKKKMHALMWDIYVKYKD